MKKETVNIYIKNPDDLKKLVVNHRISLFLKHGDIELKLDLLQDEENKLWGEKLTKYYFACGCKSGSVAAILFSFALLIYVMLFLGLDALLKWQMFFYLFIALILGAVVGKIFGLLISKYIFILTVKKISLRNI